MIVITASSVVAASCASDATAELLRYAREGNALEHWPFGEAEPTAKLAEALLRCAEIEFDSYCRPGFQDEHQQLGQLIAACRKFLEDWSHG